MLHPTAALEEWVADWEDRVLSHGGLNQGLIAEYFDMAERHPRFFGQRSAVPPPQHSFPTAVERWRSLVAAYFRSDEVHKALHVISCESNGKPDAKNPGSSASGLFQHLARYWDSRSADAGWVGASIWDPEANVAVAAWLRDQRGGWRHWPQCGR